MPRVMKLSLGDWKKLGFFMWLNVILAKLNMRQCWPAVSLWVGCGVAGGFSQGPHMAYSSASDVKSFAFCYLIGTFGLLVIYFRL